MASAWPKPSLPRMSIPHTFLKLLCRARLFGGGRDRKPPTSRGKAGRKTHHGRAARLTPREHEVALLVARGLSNRAIAEELVISEKTVKNHVQRVLDKLAMSSRTQVAASANLLSA
jgi:DNA-binding NarL/FixJ family response regulator